jgi:hypothetical protein
MKEREKWIGANDGTGEGGHDNNDDDGGHDSVVRNDLFLAEGLREGTEVEGQETKSGRH